jgi:hypothetical protein
MIIWRGWGIVALPIVLLLVFGLGTLIAKALGNGEIDGVGAGIGLLLAAAATYFLGTWMNRRAGEKAAEQYALARREQMYQQISQAAETQTWRELQGLSQADLQARWGEVHSRNWSQLESQAMAQLAAEQEVVRKKLGNHHALFFIPLQWLWIPLVIGGIAAIAGSLASSA